MDKSNTSTTPCLQNHNSSRKILFWRILNCIMGIFFMVAMGLQANDPDPAVWMLLYGITGAVSFSIVISSSLQGKRLWRIFVAVHFVCCLAMLAYVIMFYSHVIDKSSNILHNEEGRELSGVILVQLWLAIILSVSIYHEKIRECFGRSRESNNVQMA
uniref:Transmembrane protein n=1 Tax=Clytia hemisphaerica TaxID=252671 RepID=A0A7M5WR91_9CNID